VHKQLKILRAIFHAFLFSDRKMAFPSTKKTFYVLECFKTVEKECTHLMFAKVLQKDLVRAKQVQRRRLFI